MFLFFSAEKDTKEEEEASDDQVRWEYKTENTEDSELKGPYSTEQMMQWKDQGKFDSGVLCRQIGKHQFYSSNRIDFDLYL